MKKLAFFLLFFPGLLSAQLIDDFSDGDFNNNPIWSGDATQFQINSSKQLQLNSTIADNSSLTTANSLIRNTEWNFWIKLSFNTSSLNNARVYLASDQQNIEGNLNGYFVQVGETNDSIAIFRQDGLNVTRIVKSTIAFTGNSINTLRIKVVCDNLGNWTLYSDPTGAYAYQKEGIGYDTTYSTTAWFGVYCKYTISNSTKFYFDDFYIGPIMVDTIPPIISNLVVLDSTHLDIEFSEIITPSSAVDISNYVVNQNIGNPVIASVNVSNKKLVHLTFANSFQSGQTYSLLIDQISDLSGNTSSLLSETFTYYIPKAFDILITEIMADPDPVVGLPNNEYTEIYNRTTYPISLSGWALIQGTSIRFFPAVNIKPKSYLILAKNDAVAALSSFGTVVSFSSFSITNTGQTNSLINKEGQVIHTITISDSWYESTLKKNGGWSLEMVDHNNPCAENSNWKASVSPKGGTPGAINSVNALNQDKAKPELVRISILDTMNIKLFFSEKMDSSKILQAGRYSIDNGIGVPVSVKSNAPDYSAVSLSLSLPIQPNIIYKVTIIDSLLDCVGNSILLNTSVKFALARPAEPLDLVINEVLSDPKENGVDYIELYNRSKKVIDLKEMNLSDFDTLTNMMTNIKEITSEGFLIFPGDYIVLTSNPDIVKNQYFTSNRNGFVKLISMPAYNNDFGVVVISNKASVIIDKFIYDSEMHFPLLNSSDGVALERINYDKATQDRLNWHSAAQSVGFGTPAYRNSQYSISGFSEDAISITPEIFSPDMDGYNDVLNINYTFPEPGYVASVNIYNSKGLLVRKLVKSELTATQGSFTWDGITQEREKAPIGIYIVYVEVFNLEGVVKRYKKSAVLGGKLN